VSGVDASALTDVLVVDPDDIPRIVGRHPAPGVGSHRMLRLAAGGS